MPRPMSWSRSPKSPPGTRGCMRATFAMRTPRCWRPSRRSSTIARRAGLRVHISHIKVSGRNAWGKAPDVIAMIRRARKDGLEITADQYPYTASSTSLTATVIPAKYREGSDEGHDQTARRRRDRAEDEKGDRATASSEHVAARASASPATPRSEVAGQGPVRHRRAGEEERRSTS